MNGIASIRANVRLWIVIAVAVTAMSAMVYLVAQTELRTGAVDAASQIAQDAAARLNAGESVDTVVPTRKVDLRTSFTTFLIVYDLDSHPVTGSASLDGGIPVPPLGVLTHAREAGSNSLTWQPAVGVREVVAVYPTRSGFVLGGSSLQLVEQRARAIRVLIVGGWIATLGTTAIACLRWPVPFEVDDHSIG